MEKDGEERYGANCFLPLDYDRRRE